MTFVEHTKPSVLQEYFYLLLRRGADLRGLDVHVDCYFEWMPVDLIQLMLDAGWKEDCSLLARHAERIERNDIADVLTRHLMNAK